MIWEVVNLIRVLKNGMSARKREASFVENNIVTVDHLFFFR